MKYNIYQSFVSMVSGSLCCQSKYEAGVNFWTIEWIQKVKFYKMWLNYVSGKRKVSSARTEIQISTNHPTFNLFILSKPYKWFKRYKTYTYIQTVWMNRAGSICLWRTDFIHFNYEKHSFCLNTQSDKRLQNFIVIGLA